MTFLGILLTVFSAVIVSVIFYYVFKTRGPWEDFWIFLLILTLVGLAAGKWLVKEGPVMWDVAMVPMLLAIIIFALLLGAASPQRKSYAEQDNLKQETALKDRNAATFGALFWLFLVIILGIIVWSFVGGHPLP